MTANNKVLLLKKKILLTFCVEEYFTEIESEKKWIHEIFQECETKQELNFKN